MGDTLVVFNPVTNTVEISSLGSTTVEVIPTEIGTVEITAQGPQGAPGTGLFQTVNTYAIGGAIALAAGETDYIPPFFFAKRANQTSTLIKAQYQIHAGTSTTVKLKKNGSDIAGFTGIVVTTTPATTTGSVSLANGDVLSLEVTAVSGSPQNLTFTLVIEHTIT